MPTDPARPDLAIGSFSDDPPWLVEPDAMPGGDAVPTTRWVVRNRLPELTRPRRLPYGTRVFRVARHLGLAVGLWAVGARRQGGSASKADISRRLRIAAEHLGPTYIKLGQIISSGDGLFPEELVAEFKKCRDQVPAEPWWAVRQVVESELGAPLESVFAHFERTPLAAASIAQVHAATLRTGEEVVVKVQRPSVATLVHADLKVMAWLAPFLVGRIPIAALANPPALVELFAETITEELDFRLEAANMLDVARSFHDLGQQGYVVPRPAPDAGHPPHAGDGAAVGLRLRRRGRHARRRRRHRGRDPHRHGRVHGGGHDPRHLPRRPARRQPVRAGRRPGRPCSTSGSSAGWTSSSAGPSCAC